MTLEDPTRRVTVQQRASHFVKRLGNFGGLKLPTQSPASRSSLDLPNKPFFNAPHPSSLPGHHRDGGRSSYESLLTGRLQLEDSAHKKRVHSEWNGSAGTKSTLSPPHQLLRPPGIIVTQHLSNSRSESDLFAKGVASPISEEPTVIRTVMRTTMTTLTAQNFPPRNDPSFPRALPLLPHRSSQDPTVLNIFVNRAAGGRIITGKDLGQNVQLPEQVRTPLIRPCTPLASVTNSSAIPTTFSPPIMTSLIPSSGAVSHETPRPPHLTNIYTSPACPASPPSHRREVFDKEGRSLRLSPAVIQRLPPWPIRALPPISLTDSYSPTREPFGSQTLPAIRQVVELTALHGTSTIQSPRPRHPGAHRLSSMPALPMSGSVRPQLHDDWLQINTEMEPRTSNEFPEIELVQHMDEEDLDETEPTPEEYCDHRSGKKSGNAPAWTRRPGPSMHNIAENDETYLDHNLRQTDITSRNYIGRNSDSTSTLTASTSQFVARRSEPNSEREQSTREGVRTPHPSGFVSPNENPTRNQAGGSSLQHRPAPPEGNGNKMYMHHVSHSMIDLSTKPSLSAPLVPPLLPPLVASTNNTRGADAEGATQQKRGSIARRQSMPSLNVPPPPYSPGAIHEDGREPLPPYSNSIMLIAQMPRKIEFTQPGVVSRDRKWRRVLCVLEGTKFSVYRVKDMKSIWEGVVGAGDRTVFRPTDPKGKAMTEAGEEGIIRKVEEESRAIHEEEQRSSFTRWRSSTAANFASFTPSSTSSSSNISARGNSEESSRSGFHGLHRPGSSSSVCIGNEPDMSLLLREYTLQNAESGLGSDYKKRRNVIRVRMEGEQFLLQAKDVQDVVAWIEGFQAASDIALDLDERKMPRGPIFLRRRRRRQQSSSDGGGLAATPNVAN